VTNLTFMKSGLLLALAAASLAACAHRHARATPPPPPRASPGVRSQEPIGAGSLSRSLASETGFASWYGYPYHGRQSASGEIYDMETLTAAHRTLPFQTIVRVLNLENDKRVDVRITDRGPFVDGRIIDLSHAAANVIGLIGPGTARVRVDVLRMSDDASLGAAFFAVQVGAFRDRDNAERFRARMAARYGSARVVQHEGNPTLWRVLVGQETSETDARTLSEKIRRDYGEKNAFVVRLDS